MITIILLLFVIVIAFFIGIIIGIKFSDINRYRHCKLIRINNYFDKNRSEVIRKLNK
jgi:ABC-type dipeptide/oligopeptide/nickel transport system permease component